MTRKELAKKAGMKSGETLTKRLAELEESGFISQHTALDKKKTGLIYRLSDFYSFFI